ncbi:MAG: hypothetical protein ACT4TC_19045 [Myxococcaceae bacterium]
MLKTKSVVIGWVAIASFAFAGEVLLPHTFQPNSSARASEVNANFAALKAAVDSLMSREPTCAAGTVKTSGLCMEQTLRSSAAWSKAAENCSSTDGFLCPASSLVAACNKVRVDSDSGEWSSNVVAYRQSNGLNVNVDWGARVGNLSAVTGCTPMASFFTDAELVRGMSLPYRCCFTAR